MSNAHDHAEGRHVPGIGGPGAVEGAPDGQSALRLHAGIAVIAAVLCAFVTVVYVWLGTPVPAAVFGILTLGCLGIVGWATARRRRGQRMAAEPLPHGDHRSAPRRTAAAFNPPAAATRPGRRGPP